MIRRACEKDISRIAEILVFGKRVAYRPIFNDDEGSFNELLVADVIDEYRSGALKTDDVLIYDDGIVRGMLRRAYDGDEAELVELYVEPFFIGTGIGRELMNAFLREAKERGAKSVFLWVISLNAGARRFYEATGFAEEAGLEREIGTTGVYETRYKLTF